MGDGHNYGLADLIYLMQRLRDPEDGCSWDIEQGYKDIVPSTIEEAYEVADAIERSDYASLKEELGDYLFQAVFYCQLADEMTLFDLEDVIDSLVSKLVRRHPHVFPTGELSSRRSSKDDDQRVNQRWEELKQEERNQKGLSGIFDDVPLALPALSRSQKLQKRAAQVGFDWDNTPPIFEKIQEEIDEVNEAISDGDKAKVEEEIGDLLFTCVNLSRHLKVDAETALRRSSAKFQRRVSEMEEMSSESEPPNALAGLTNKELELLWEKVKQVERRG